MAAHLQTDDCIGAEDLAAFAEGKLPRSEVAKVLAHIDHCPSCFYAFRDASHFAAGAAESAAPFRWPLALAAALIIAVVIAVPFIRRRESRSEPALARLTELVPRSSRSVEPRVSGGFEWAPYRGPVRARDAAPDAQQLRLTGAAGDAVAAADAHPSADAEQTAGVALLLIARDADAVARLEAATQRDASDARVWSDLAAARYSAALHADAPSKYAEALAAADRALRITPRMPEALFNRALILERLGLAQQARAAWQLYLAVDGSSKWAAEASDHLRALPATTGEDRFRSDQPSLERAALAGDARQVAQIVARYPQQSRAFAEAESLGRWGEAVAANDDPAAARQLEIARASGSALQAFSGESLLIDAVHAIDAANASQRQTIADAHRTYRRGRLAYSHYEVASAESSFRHAAALFASVSDPMSLVARYYAGSARFDAGDVQSAHNELEALLGETQRRPGALSLVAQIEWELSLCLMVNDDWQSALGHVVSARSAFEKLGEQANLGFLDGLLADTLVCLGRSDDGWASRIRAFEIQSREGRGDRLAVSIDGAVRMDLRTGRLGAARAMVAIEEAINRAARNDVLLSNTLAREAILDGELGDAATASEDAREAAVVAQRIVDGARRLRAMTDANFAAGALLVRSDPRRAIAALGAVIESYQSMEKPHFLPECYLLRGQAERSTGDDDAAAADFRRGIDFVEGHRVTFAGSISGSGVFDARTALFHEAVRLQLDKGDVPAALEFAERRRAQLVRAAPFSVTALQQRLAGSGCAILEIVALPDEVATFAVTERDVAVARRAQQRAKTVKLRNAVASGDDAAARELYDLLLQPHESLLANTRRLIIVADSDFKNVPFATLIDRRSDRRLVERFAVAVAPAAASLQVEGSMAGDALLEVSLPSLDGDALAERGAELRDVAALYRHAVALGGAGATFPAVEAAAASANVIHIAGHTARQPGAGDAALVFASDRGEPQPVSWRAAAGAPLPRHSIVVLAACETLRAPAASSSFSMSVGDGFLAAGASDVIGTLDPIPDNEARKLFEGVHRRLAAHLGAAEAVRRTQIEAMHAVPRIDSWRALALITRHIRS